MARIFKFFHNFRIISRVIKLELFLSVCIFLIKMTDYPTIVVLPKLPKLPYSNLLFIYLFYNSWKLLSLFLYKKKLLLIPFGINIPCLGNTALWPWKWEGAIFAVIQLHGGLHKVVCLTLRRADISLLEVNKKFNSFPNTVL